MKTKNVKSSFCLFILVACSLFRNWPRPNLIWLSIGPPRYPLPVPCQTYFNNGYTFSTQCRINDPWERANNNASFMWELCGALCAYLVEYTVCFTLPVKIVTWAHRSTDIWYHHFSTKLCGFCFNFWKMSFEQSFYDMKTLFCFLIGGI